MKSKNAVIVGRFQVPFFTEDHKGVIQKVIDEHEEVLFVVGLSFCTASLEDPLNFRTRVQMIREQFDSEKISIVYLQDTHSDEDWSQKLDILVSKTLGDSAVIYGSGENFVDRYTGEYQTAVMDRISVLNTDSLKTFLSHPENGHDDPNLAYRLGAFHVALNTFNNPMPVVDMAVVDEDNLRILLGRKKGQKLYRFFGGFAENHIRTYEEDALREIEEEAGLYGDNVGEPQYITSMLINDWRYRSVERKIKTAFFYVPYHNGTPKANDDIEEVRWFELAEFKYNYRNLLVKSHAQLADVLMHKLNKTILKDIGVNR